MRRIRGTLVAGAAAFATLVGLAGPASAATGAERFTVIVRSGSAGDSCTIVAAGPISGVGSCVIENVSEEETIVHATISGSSFDLIATTQSETDVFNDEACVFRFTSSDAFVIEGVSGVFANASGSGTDTVRGTFIAPHAASGCSEEGGSGIIVATGTGTVTV
jgi:hypothetical protein